MTNPTVHPTSSLRSAPRKHRPAPWRTLAILAGAIFLVGFAAPNAMARLAGGSDRAALTTVFSYQCSSSHGPSAASYTIVGTAPVQVAPGETFALTNVIITGTPTIDLLLASLTFHLDAPLGATSVDGLRRTIIGPGATNPPGPVAKAGIPNSTPPFTFTFIANGAAGTTVNFFSGNIDAVVVETVDPLKTTPVVCTRTSSGEFLSTKIVAAPPTSVPTTAPTTSAPPTTTTSAPPTTTTSAPPTTTTSELVRVLGANATRTDVATPVVASVAFTG